MAVITPPNTADPTNRLDEARLIRGFWFAFAGLAVIAAVALVPLIAMLFGNHMVTASEITSLVGAVTGSVGTLVGTFLGYNIGSSGKEKIARDLNAAQARVRHYAAHMSPEQVQKADDDLRKDMGGG